MGLSESIEIIRKVVMVAPERSGVYRMHASDGVPLYIGKASNLKKRIASYTKQEGMPWRTMRMISQTTSIEYTITASEAEALLLEASLVRQHQPRYNILLKDDKSFPYIHISTDHPFPRISKYRGSKTGKGKFYGPFPSAGDVRETLRLLQKTFLVRPCSDRMFEGRTRPCLEYQIKRCSAPCVEFITKEEYQKRVTETTDLLAGKSREFKETLVQQMEKASAQMDYEKAAEYRDRLKALAQIQARHSASGSVDDADVIGLWCAPEGCAVHVMIIRDGQSFGSRHYFPQHTEDRNPGEVLEAFLAGFYQTHPLPPLICVSHEPQDIEVLEEALTSMAKAKLQIIVPRQGEKRRLVELAVENAREALARKIKETMASEALLKELQAVFGLQDIPTRIEVYDNSHIMGTSAVGAMIVAGPEGFVRNAYRKFNLARFTEGKTQITGGDDYAMLEEMLMRRFSKAKKEEGWAWPDLILIDGGPGHLSVAIRVLQTLGIEDVAMACIAKGPDRNAGREEFYLPNREPFSLPPGDPVLFYLQRLRDEAHRFAIGTHRKRRSKAMGESILDVIDGIGGKRKKALLHHFGSARAVAQASITDLERVEGISKKTALAIYEHLHGSISR